METYEKKKADIVTKIEALKTEIKEKKPRKKRESKKKPLIFSISHEPTKVSFD
jgi:hypothetical protein